MKLIIGGAYQGKKQYAREHYGGMEPVCDFHLLVREWLKDGVDPMAYVEEHLSRYTEKVIICDDIFCGIVPVDPFERKWRESLGYLLARLTGECDEVVRVFCGLGTRLK